jgi:hypothetical protein
MYRGGSRTAPPIGNIREMAVGAQKIMFFSFIAWATESVAPTGNREHQFNKEGCYGSI